MRKKRAWTTVLIDDFNSSLRIDRMVRSYTHTTILTLKLNSARKTSAGGAISHMDELARRAAQLKQKLAQPVRAIEIFVDLYDFVSAFSLQTWLNVLGETYLSLAPQVDQHREWGKKIRCSIGLALFDGALQVAGLEAALERLAEEGHETEREAARGVLLAMMVFDRAFLGVHPLGAYDKSDTPEIAELRTQLRQGMSLYETSDRRLRVYPAPLRENRTHKTGVEAQDFLKCLCVAKVDARLTIEYICDSAASHIGSTEYLCFGYLPVIWQLEELDWQVMDNTNYRATHRSELVDSIVDRVCCGFEALCNRGAQLVVLPELVGHPLIRDALRKRIKRRVRDGIFVPALVMSGSEFEPSIPSNRAYVLTANGNILWSQDKMQPYTFTTGAQQNAQYPFGRDDLRDRREDIDTANPRLVIADVLPSERAAVLICEDFCQREPHLDGLYALKANLLFVPVMDGIRPPDDWIMVRGRELSKRPGTKSAISNSGTLAAVTHLPGDPRRHYADLFLPDYWYWNQDWEAIPADPALNDDHPLGWLCRLRPKNP